MQLVEPPKRDSKHQTLWRRKITFYSSVAELVWWLRCIDFVYEYWSLNVFVQQLKYISGGHYPPSLPWRWKQQGPPKRRYQENMSRLCVLFQLWSCLYNMNPNICNTDSKFANMVPIRGSSKLPSSWIWQMITTYLHFTFHWSGKTTFSLHI